VIRRKPQLFPFIRTAHFQDSVWRRILKKREQKKIVSITPVRVYKSEVEVEAKLEEDFLFELCHLLHHMYDVIVIGGASAGLTADRLYNACITVFLYI